MAKRTLAILLTVCMLVGLAPQVFALEPYTAEDAIVHVDGEKTTIGEAKGIKFNWKIHASAFDGTTQFIITYDTTKLQPVTTQTTPADITLTSTWGNVSRFVGSNTDVVYVTGSSNGMLRGNNKATIMAVLTTENSGSTPCTDCADALTTAGWFSFKLLCDDYDDLDSSSIHIATPSEVEQTGQSSAVVLSVNSNNIVYNSYNSTARYTFQTAPRLTLEGQDFPLGLADVEVEMDYTAVNSPKLLPSVEADRKVAVKSVKPLDAAGNEFDAAEAAKVTYTYSLKKVGATETDPAGELTDAEKAYFSIDATSGEVTIKAGAPITDLVIVATGSYTNTKGNTSTADGEGTLAVKHGDAGDVVPGGDSTGDADPVFSGVKIEKDNIVLVTSNAGSEYTETIGIPADGSANNEVTFIGTPIDQFGGAFDGQTGAWDNPTTATGVTVSDGTVTVAPGATGVTFDYTYTAGAHSATVEVVVSNTVISWPTLTNDTIYYGQPISDLTIGDDGKVVDHGVEITDASFAWDVTDTTAKLDAGTVSLTMKVTYTPSGATEAESSTKVYPIAVNKAKLAVVLNNEDIVLDGENGIQLPKDSTITFADDIALENTSVQDENGKNLIVTGITPTYTLTDELNLLTKTGTPVESITGAKESGSGETATLAIAVSGQTNYEDLSKSLSIKVIKPVLDATISFADGTPTFGKEIVATVTESLNQNNSLTTDLTYEWGEIVIENGEEKFKALETDGRTSVTGNLTDITAGNYTSDPKVPATATVKYTPVAGDVGKTLALVVHTPSESTTYGWIHSVQNKMAAPVARATWGTISGSVKSVTTTSITVKGETDAWFAIALKNAPTVTAGDEETSDGHTWVQSVDGADVTFTTDDTGATLTPNTEYTVFMKKEADGYETANTTFNAKTARDSITPQPNPDDPDNPIPPTIDDVTVTATIAEPEDGLKFGKTLTASVTVTEDTPHNPAITISADQWEYNWYRVTPAEGENPETEELITEGETTNAHTGNTYSLAEVDIGKVIRVKATTKATCDYIAYANDDTSDKIAKADGPEFTNTLGADKASKADVADGTITGLTAETGYEYIVKPVKAEAETEEPTPDWTNATKATANTEGKITGLGANTYLVRIPSTNTHEASDYQEITVGVLGYDITGKVTSNNGAWATTYTLYSTYDIDADTGTAIDGHEDVTLIAAGAADVDGSNVTAGTHTYDFTISGIANGTYILVLRKDAHLDLVIENLVVNDGAVNLDPVTLTVGDIDGNGSINLEDRNQVTFSTNFSKSITDDGVNGLTDLDGNGSINLEDANIITFSTNFSQTVKKVKITLS